MGEGLRKLPHPPLWFLVGPPWQQVEGSVCHSSNKGSKTKVSQGTMGTEAKAPKTKYTTHLSFDWRAAEQPEQPGLGAVRKRLIFHAQAVRVCIHTSIHIHMYQYHTRSYTTGFTGLRPVCSQGPAHGLTLDLMLGSLCLAILNF